MTPSNGRPMRDEDRRHVPSRREEDKIAHDMQTWVATLFVHRGKLVALASILTFLFTSLGFRILGPSQDIQTLDRKFTVKDSLMSVRVDRIEDRQNQIRNQLADIQQELKFQNLLLCNVLRTTNPNLALDGCSR